MSPQVFDPFKSPEQSIKDKANQREKRLAKQVGKNTRRQPNSGAIAGFKGDLIDDDFLYDSKGTDAESISVKASDWMKIKREAYARNKEPALILTVCNFDLVCVSKEVFNKLIGK